jgi:hypothetical protein
VIPLTRQDVLAHQAVVPWPVQHQIEQDLLLCRAMVALFSDPFLKGQIAMRGGTVLHKARRSLSPYRSINRSSAGRAPPVERALMFRASP